MKHTVSIVLLGIALIAAPACFAQQAAAPAGSTGQCKDGSYTNHATKKGACSGHQGVKEWYTADSAAAPAKVTAAPTAAAPAAPPPASNAPPAAAAHSNAMPPKDAAPGGGPGMVWVNGSSKVYHCPGDKWYGKTKQGSYMSEGDAKAKGFHADHGKSCTS